MRMMCRFRSWQRPYLDGTVSSPGGQVAVHEAQALDGRGVPVDRQRRVLECCSVEGLFKMRSALVFNVLGEGRLTRTPFSPAAATILRLSNCRPVMGWS